VGLFGKSKRAGEPLGNGQVSPAVLTPGQDFDVVGESFRAGAFVKIKRRLGANDGDSVTVEAQLIVDPKNPHSKSGKAVAVHIDGQHVGFVPDNSSSGLFDLLQTRGGKATCGATVYFDTLSSPPMNSVRLQISSPPRFQDQAISAEAAEAEKLAKQKEADRSRTWRDVIGDGNWDDAKVDAGDSVLAHSWDVNGVDELLFGIAAKFLDLRTLDHFSKTETKLVIVNPEGRHFRDVIAARSEYGVRITTIDKFFEDNNSLAGNELFTEGRASLKAGQASMELGLLDMAYWVGQMRLDKQATVIPFGNALYIPDDTRGGYSDFFKLVKVDKALAAKLFDMATKRSDDAVLVAGRVRPREQGYEIVVGDEVLGKTPADRDDDFSRSFKYWPERAAQDQKVVLVQKPSQTEVYVKLAQVMDN
jgi:hypothetical protein